MSDEAESAPGSGSPLADVDDKLHEYFTWYPVAKKDFKDAIRSRGLWILSAVFTLIFISPVGVALYAGGIGPSVPDGGLGMRLIIERFYLDLVTTVLPIVTLFVGVAAMTKEKTSGSLKILLSLPFSRRSVIVGKVIGRCAVVAVPFLVAASITAVFFSASRVSFDPEMYAFFMLYSLVFAMVMVSIAVSISGAVSTTLRSIIGNAVIYVYFTFMWNTIANEIGNFLATQVGVSRSFRWNTVLFIKLLSPTQAYKTLVNSMLTRFSQPVQPQLQSFANRWNLSLSQMSPQQYSRYNLFNVQGSLFSPGLPAADQRSLCESVVGATYRNVTLTTNNASRTVTVTNGNQTQVFQNMNVSRNVTQTSSFCTGGSDLPFYLSDPAVVLFLLAWVGIAAAFSYYTFDRVDL
jgi:ABC-2 type transport system permease protein